MPTPLEPLLPPHDIVAEEALLGSVLLDGSVLALVGDRLQPGDFYREQHRLLYAGILDLAARGSAIDIVTVEAALRERLPEIALLAINLLNRAPVSVHAPHYAEIVRQHAARRRLLQTALRINTMAGDTERSFAEVLTESQALLLDVQDPTSRGDFRDLGSLIHDVLDQLGDSASAGPPQQPLRFATGLLDLDRLLGGFGTEDLIIVGARPSVGKTALAASIAHKSALKHQRTIGLFCLEMSALAMAGRLLSLESGLEGQRWQHGDLDDREWERLIEAAGVLTSCRIHIDDSPGLTVAEVRARSRRLAQREPLHLIIVDYLQLLLGRRERGEANRQAEVADISRSLKLLARELHVPVLALAQVSRGVEQRADHRPMLSDLRESGGLEADADVVMFIYRDEIYNPESADRGTAELIVAKHRNGPTGTVKLFWNERLARFGDLALLTLD